MSFFIFAICYIMLIYENLNRYYSLPIKRQVIDFL
nr:MAG TPA: hypothetical protein [Caudoviricetes sp.]